MSRLPEWIEPKLATLVDRPFSDPEWIYERKIDGVRCLAYRDGATVHLYSRNRKRLDAGLSELVEAVRGLPGRRFVLDGEITAMEGRQTSFTRLQRRGQLPRVRVLYYVFDLLHLDGRDTRALPLRERKELLRDSFAFEDPVRYLTHRNTRGEALLQEACRKGWEGLIAKDARTPYRGGRSRDWLKLKCVRRQELVIGGWTDPQRSRPGLGALLVGFYEEERLRYAGKVGTGFDEATLHDLRARLGRIEIRTSPFADAKIPLRGVHWSRPRLVAEVAFTEWTSDGRLRHPRYLGLRRDKDPRDVVRERAASVERVKA